LSRILHIPGPVWPLKPERLVSLRWSQSRRDPWSWRLPLGGAHARPNFGRQPFAIGDAHSVLVPLRVGPLTCAHDLPPDLRLTGKGGWSGRVPRLFLFPFRFRSPITGKWVRVRHVAEREVIARAMPSGKSSDRRRFGTSIRAFQSVSAAREAVPPSPVYEAS